MCDLEVIGGPSIFKFIPNNADLTTRHGFKKSRNVGGKCHVRTMMYSDTGESYKVNTHHVSLRQRSR